MSQSQMAQFCRPENHIRDSYYSDAYRANFRLDGEQRDWDVIHVSIPFSPEKEQRFMQRFGVAKEEMPLFYEDLAKRLPFEAKLLRDIHKDDRYEALAANMIRFLYIESVPKIGRGSDLYYISEPLEPLIGSPIFPGQEITLLNLLQLGARFTQMLKLLLGTGIHIGAFDLDTVYLTQPNDEKRMIKLGSLLHASTDESTPKSLPTMPPYAKAGQQSIKTDIDALCGLLWLLADGRHYTSSPDYSRPPRYAPEEFTIALRWAMSAEDENAAEALKAFHNDLFHLIRKIRKGELPDVRIPISTAAAPVPAPAPETESERSTPQQQDANPRPEEEPPSLPSLTAPVAPTFNAREPDLHKNEELDGAEEYSLEEILAEFRNQAPYAQEEPVITDEDFFIYQPASTPVVKGAHARKRKVSRILPVLLLFMSLVFCLLVVLDYAQVLDPFQISFVHDAALMLQQWIGA